jgi:transcriptional repressor of cell division inhibition gene dicB
MLKSVVLVHFGDSQIAVARALGITKSAVSQWPDLVPLKSALRLQSITGGALRVNMADYELAEIQVRASAPKTINA